MLDAMPLEPGPLPSDFTRNDEIVSLSSENDNHIGAIVVAML